MSALARIADEPPPLALDLPDDLSFDGWIKIGRLLCLGSQALNWHIGDWWAFGEHKYGERAQAAAEGVFGKSFSTLKTYGSVARAFAQTSRRLDAVPFSFHQEVAALPAEEADGLLSRAAAEGWSTRDLRREVQELKIGGPKPKLVSSLEREFGTFYELYIEMAEAYREPCPECGHCRDLAKPQSEGLTMAVSYRERMRWKNKPERERPEGRYKELLLTVAESRAMVYEVNRWCVRTKTNYNKLVKAADVAPSTRSQIRFNQRRMTLDVAQRLKNAMANNPNGISKDEHKARTQIIWQPLPDEEIESRRINREPCPMCGTRADIGCKHSIWSANSYGSNFR